jgi:hypothetical protein
MKSFITLVFAGAVLLVSGQFFGWWMAPIPGFETIPSYQQRKMARENARSKKRQISGMEDEHGNKISDDDSKRRSEALKNGGGVTDY